MQTLLAVVQDRGLSQAVIRARQVTASLPPCLFVPHTVATWSSPSSGPAVVAGEALATVGVCTLAALLQGVSEALFTLWLTMRLSAAFEVFSGFIFFRTNHVVIGCGKDQFRW